MTKKKVQPSTLPATAPPSSEAALAPAVATPRQRATAKRKQLVTELPTPTPVKPRRSVAKQSSPAPAPRSPAKPTSAKPTSAKPTSAKPTSAKAKLAKPTAAKPAAAQPAAALSKSRSTARSVARSVAPTRGRKTAKVPKITPTSTLDELTQAQALVAEEVPAPSVSAATTAPPSDPPVTETPATEAAAPPVLSVAELWEQGSPIRTRIAQLKTRNSLLEEQLQRMRPPVQVRGKKK